MTRLTRMLAACAAFACLAGALAAGAQAEAPEFGRCLKKAIKGGAGFKVPSCTKATGAKAKYEWVPGPGPDPNFALKERFVVSYKDTRCVAARSFEQVAEEREQRANEAEANGFTEEAEELRQEATRLRQKATTERELAGLSKAECETLIENEKLQAPVRLVTTHNKVLTCWGLAGTGEYTGPKTLTETTLTFTECEGDKGQCQSSGAAAGEIVTAVWEGELGVVKAEPKPTRDQIGLDLKPIGPVATEFSCGGGPTSVVTGSVIHRVHINAMIGIGNEAFSQSGGKQNPEAFEGMPPDVLEATIEGGPVEQAGLVVRDVITNGEPIEVSTIN
jgi:hypothetical protein